MNLRLSSVLATLLLGTALHAGNIEIVTKFSKTGGIYGDLNTIGDMVNGRQICEKENDNNNSVPGCDMSQDPEYNNNGTDDNVADDYYTGDLIVRTNDIFEIKVGWNATEVNNPITLTSTLPSFDGKNYLKWESLPASCKEGSSISEDGLTITCVRTEDASISYSEDSPFYVKVRAKTPNDIKTGEISFSISSDGLETKTDSTDGYGLTITAKPMWNIQNKHVETFSGQTYNGQEGYIIKYAYLLEADEVIGEKETSSAVLGNEALGNDFSLHFTDDVSEISPNAELVGCSVLGAEGAYEPYPWYHSDAPDKSVGSIKLSLNVNCSQSAKGGDISIDYTGIDASLRHVPTLYANGGIIPKTRMPVASGVIDIFVPLDDIKNATDIGNDSTQLDTNNTITSFDPDSISGQSNFNSLAESTNDNSIPVPLIYHGPGYTSGSYHKYFSNSVDSLTPLPDTTNSFYSADGVLTPDKPFASWVYISNDGNRDFNNTILCDVVDANLYDVVDIDTDTNVSAVKLYGDTEELTYTLEYATGYVSDSWPPALDQDNSSSVINECKDSTIQWYGTTKEARGTDNNPITKVRLKLADGLPAGNRAGFIINLKARSEELSGATIESGTDFVNYSALYDTVLVDSDDNWVGSTRILNHYPTPASGGDYRADRAVLVRAKVRTTKELSTTIVEPSDEVTVHIESTFTTESQSPESSDVKITEMLAPGLNYVVGSGSIGDPTIGSCKDIEDIDPLKDVCTEEHQVLVWDLGERKANDAIEDIEYNFVVSAFASSGENSTYTVISSPTDTSHPNVRKANRNISINIPTSLFISKEVNTPFREINQNPIEFTSYARNGSSETLNNIDIIDIIPFNGDGAKGFHFSVGSTKIEKKRDLPTAFNGTLAFSSVSSGHACESGVTWYYTDRDPTQMDIAPTAISNKDGGETVWCQGTEDGVTKDSCGYDNSAVTAVRLKGGDLESDATCSFKILLKPQDNKKGDVYTNTASAYANGVSLPTLSNDVSAFVPSTLLGDYVWLDYDADGIQDADEIGAEGIRMTLLDSSEEELNSTTTDENGRYIFEELTVDTEYKVKATLPDYYRFTKKGDGTNYKKDSDIIVDNPDDITGVTVTKTLNDNQQYRHFDVGIISTLTISGKAYRQEDNSSVDGMRVELYRDENSDGVLDENDTLIDSKSTADNGEINYKFTNIFNGDYLILISGIEDGYRLESSDTLVGHVDGESLVHKDFRYNKIPESQDIENSEMVNTLGATDIEDLNASDDRDIDHFIIKNLPNSDAGILYYYDGETQIAVQEGDELTPEQARGLKFDPNTGFMGNVWFNYSSVDDEDEESNRATVWLTIFGNSTISNLAWYDENRDGIQNGSSEIGIAGVELRLLGEDGKVINNPVGRFQTPYIVTTDSNGNYIFENLSDGNYTVEIVNTNGYAISDKSQGDDITVDSDFDISTFKTGTIELGVDEDNPNIDVGLFVPTLSGHLYHDGNGNSSVDGNLTDNADGTQLYITLVQSGKAVATKTLTTEGNYTFDIADGLKAYADYTIVLNYEANKTTFRLPVNWFPENNDNGTLSISIEREDIVDQDFGINKKPIAKNVDEAIQFNPGGENNVTIPPFDIGDLEDVTPTTVVITKVPSDAKLYYNGVLVKNNQTFAEFNQSTFLIDPNDGDLNVTFNYKTVDRAGVSSDEATITMPFDGLEISGSLYADGNNNHKVDGEKIGFLGLFVTLLDRDENRVLASKAIDENGNYLFDNGDGILNDRNYTIVLTTTENNTIASLPEGWNNADGEQIGSEENGTDKVDDGIIDVNVLEVDIPNINFGINERPVAEDKNIGSVLNPGGEERVVLPRLPISDNEDGTPTTIKIVTLPEDGRLYYDGELIESGEYIINDYNLSLLRVDPDAGEPIIEFKYLAIDQSGVESNIATVTYPFSGISVSGNLYADGNNDDIINGTLINNVNDKPIYVTLLSSSDKVIASTQIDGAGAYNFSASSGYIEPHKSYTLVISTEANQTYSTLPSNWNHFDGEGIGLVDENGVVTPADSDGNRDGLVVVDVIENSVPEINFGINQQSVATDNNATSQLNPGQDTTVIVPTLDIKDQEDDTPTTVTIKTLPTNGTLYYDGELVVADENITDFNNSLLRVDPIDGEQIVIFTYTTTDAAGFESDVATVTMPFRGLKISGNIFDDGNSDGDVNGIRISKAGDVQLFVNLLDDNGSLISSYQLEVDADNEDNESNISSVVGLYSFDGNDSVTANTNYRIILTTESNATTAKLPVDWNNTDGEYSPSNCIQPLITAKTSILFSKTCGMDSIADGAIDIHTKTDDIPNINFGINERPTTKNVASRMVLNPNKKVQVIDLLPKDREDGIPHIVTINTLPRAGTLYYDDIKVVAEQNITDFNNSKLMVRPNSGNTVVVFTYSATDTTGWTSIDTSRVRMPFYVPAPAIYAIDDEEEVDEEQPFQELPVEKEPSEEESDDTQSVIFNLDISDDSVEANREGEVTTIYVLSNDEVVEGVTIELLDFEDGEVLWSEGTAVGGTNIMTTDEVYVPGEGTWRVVDNTVTFTAEDGFTGTPTPIYYLVKDEKGNQSNIAELSISTPCDCKAYVSKSSDSVSALESFGMFALLFMQILSVFFFKKEESE